MTTKARGVPVATVAKMLNLTPRRVQQLAAEGVLPKPSRGRYDLAGCVRAYITSLQEQVRRAGVPGTSRQEPGVADADRRERLARAALAEMKAAEMRGASVLKSAYRDELRLVAQRLRAGILGMPGSQAEEVVGLPDRAAGIAALQRVAQRLLAVLQRAMDGAPPLLEVAAQEEDPAA